MSREGAQLLGWIVLAVAVLVGCVWYGLSVCPDQPVEYTHGWERK